MGSPFCLKLMTKTLARLREPCPPVDRRVKKRRKKKKAKILKEKEETEKEKKCFSEPNSKGKKKERKKVGNWSMPLHTLLLIMCKNLSFSNKNFLNSP